MSQHRRVLVFDDSTDSCEAITELLHGWGFEVDLAEDGRQAREMVVAFEPDIVITALSLPGGDACDVIMDVRARRGDGVFIVAYSGRRCLEAAARAAGANAFVLKPDTDYLERLVMVARPVQGSEAGVRS